MAAVLGLASMALGIVPEWVLTPMGRMEERIYGIFGSEWFSYFQEFELLTQPLTAMLASLCCTIVLRRSHLVGAAGSLHAVVGDAQVQLCDLQ